jgi:hypothetical protein
MTQVQSGVVSRTAYDWRRRANAGTYPLRDFGKDFSQMQFEFNSLRQLLHWMGSLAIQVNSPAFDNAVAELDAGLRLISESLVFLENQAALGTLNRATILRTCRVLEQVTKEWERELWRIRSQFGLV